MQTVKDFKPGDIVETLSSSGVPTGNVYRIAENVRWRSAVYAWRNHRQGKTIIGTDAPCRQLFASGSVDSYSF